MFVRLAEDYSFEKHIESLNVDDSRE